MNSMTRQRRSALAARGIQVENGHQFGSWVVLREVDALPAKSAKRFSRMFACRCQCGTERSVRLSDLRGGKSTNCGCLQARALLQASTKHGRAYTALNHIWRGMKDRCLNPNNSDFHNYGGRGIKVCAEWLHDFAAFAAHVGERPAGTTLDRIDSDGDYTPGNVRWATTKQQARNTRRTRFVTYRGERMALADACERAGVDHKKAYHYVIKRGGSYAGIQQAS